MNVTIVGGGFCGAIIAKNLEKNKSINLTVIDNKKYFEYRPGLIKVISNQKHKEKIVLDYDHFLKNTKVIQEKVTSISPNKIKTGKKEYDYDYLVISYGIKYPIFLKNKKKVFIVNEINTCEKAVENIKNSQKILIVGGGLIGVEVAGEIATEYPEKKVIIVHSKNRLIERNSIYVSKMAEYFLKRKNVKIIYNEKIVQNKNNIFITSKKQKINADIAIWCAGNKCESSLLNDFKDNIFSKKGCLKVDEYLRLKGYDNIFVGGDITDINEEKTAQNSKRHAKFITKNINNIIDNKNLKEYKKFKGPIFISLGPKKGIFVFGKISYFGYLPNFFKNFIESWFFHTIGF